MYSFALGGSGWEMVPCMVTFLEEVRDCVDQGLLNVTNLGQLGDARHQAEPTSRHNPAKAPNGRWYVCAADFGGPDYPKLANFHQAMYRAHDPRVYNHGFCQWGDGYGLSWYDGGREWTGRDQGHCHFDVTMAFPQLSANWWVDSLASTAPWGLANFLRTGSLSADSNSASPITSEEDDMTPDQAKQLAFVYSRLDATSPDAEFFVSDDSGKATLVGRNTPGARPVAMLDTMDGNAIMLTLRQISARLAALEAKSGTPAS